MRSFKYEIIKALYLCTVLFCSCTSDKQENRKHLPAEIHYEIPEIGREDYEGNRITSTRKEDYVEIDNEQSKWRDSTLYLAQGKKRSVIFSYNADSVKLTFTKDNEVSQVFEYLFDIIAYANPKVIDYNGDGFLDFSYHSTQSARGANIARKLFIFDSNLHQFRVIKNSEDYPNPEYNPLTKGLRSVIFTATVSTHFLKIEGDSLVEYASISPFDLGDGYGHNIIIKTTHDTIEKIDSTLKYG